MTKLHVGKRLCHGAVGIMETVFNVMGHIEDLRRFNEVNGALYAHVEFEVLQGGDMNMCLGNAHTTLKRGCHT
jgi:hypothetical protein